MRIRHILILPAVLIVLILNSCKSNQTDESITINPEAGTSYKSGAPVAVKVHYGAGTNPDSVVYLIDSAKAGMQKDSSAFEIKTDTLSLGPRVITARIYHGGRKQEVSTNIVLLPAKAPELYTFKVVKTFPHDTSSFTEGLVYENGFLYESAGGYLDPPPEQDKTQQSSLRRVDLTTGKVLQKVMISPKVFAEGIAIVGNRIIQLTYHEKIGYIYDRDSFKLLGTFPNNIGVEGWGLCFDGKKLYMDDKTNRIWFLNKDSYRETGFIDVYDNNGAVESVNELEYIDGKIYANVWETNTIVVIDPKTGAVLQKIDLTNLYPQAQRSLNADVLNGIAYDEAGKRIFITGKKWPHLYQVEFVRK